MQIKKREIIRAFIYKRIVSGNINTMEFPGITPNKFKFGKMVQVIFSWPVSHRGG
jgi:hypothetical protein